MHEMQICTRVLLGSQEGFVKYLILDGVIAGRMRYEVYNGVATVRVIEIHKDHRHEAVEDKLVEALYIEYQGKIKIKTKVLT